MRPAPILLLLALICCISAAFAAETAPVAVEPQPSPEAPPSPPADPLTAEPEPEATPPVPAKPDPLLLRYLNIRGYGAARWSADGAQLAFTSTWTGSPQKWLMPSSGGFPTQITYFEDAADFCDFSPHDPGLMWTGVAAGGNERTQLYLTSPDGVRMDPLAIDPAVIHNAGGWSRDGSYVSYVSNARNEQFFDVYVTDLLTGQARMVFSRDSRLGAGEFSPSGDWLLVSDSLSNVNNFVYLVDRRTGTGMLLTPHEGEASFNDFNWADDNTIYFITNENREFAGIARMTLPAGLEATDPVPSYEMVYTPERDVEGIAVSDDGRFIGWQENADGFGEAHLAGLPGMQPLPLPAPAIPAGIQSVGQFNRQSTHVILQVSPATEPTGIWSYDLGTGATTRLTYPNLGGLDPSGFVQPRAVEFTSFDGLRLTGIWYEPRGGKPAGGWPVIVEAHGGPEGQSRPYFSPQTQLYLSRGVGTLLVNPRGSSGYGKTFMTLDNAGLRENSVADYAAARDWLVSSGMADPARIAITGGSYGGYVVLAALTLYPDKWAAGIDWVGIANFETFLENTGAYRRAIREAEYGSLANDREMLRAISPIHKVDRIQAPLLIVHGTNDPRVPVGEAQQMHDALAALGRDVDLLVFEDEGHGAAKLDNQAISWSRELAFLKRTLGF